MNSPMKLLASFTLLAPEDFEVVCAKLAHCLCSMDPAVKVDLEHAVKEAASGGVMVGLQKILSKLSELGLLRTQIIEPQHVGTHPLNRDGFGISAQQVHQLLDDIVSVGFDPREPNAICCDVSQADDSVYVFNHSLSESSGGLLPSVQRHQLVYASLSASHVNAALRCILAGSPHQDGSPLVAQGKLQLEQA